MSWVWAASGTVGAGEVKMTVATQRKMQKCERGCKFSPRGLHVAPMQCPGGISGEGEYYCPQNMPLTSASWMTLRKVLSSPESQFFNVS